MENLRKKPDNQTEKNENAKSNCQVAKSHTLKRHISQI